MQIFRYVRVEYRRRPVDQTTGSPFACPLRGSTVTDQHHQIGEVADRVGLSLRTIRYYEEIGLVEPSGRTNGGFRLYTEADIERLRLVKALKPVGMSLEALGELLQCAELLSGAEPDDLGEVEHRFQDVLAQAHHRCDELEERLRAARAALRELDRLQPTGGR